MGFLVVDALNDRLRALFGQELLFVLDSMGGYTLNRRFMEIVLEE